MFGVIDNPSVLVQKFPASMTGKKLRKKLGIDKPRVLAARSFKVCAKFMGVKQRNRLAFLRRMASKVIGVRTFVELNKARKDFDRNKINSLPLSEKKMCYCCVKNQAVLRHHVITLLNGGRNKRNNIVPLCNQCHVKVHPHMQRKKSGRLPLGTVLPQNNGPIVVNPKADKDNICVRRA
jgi:hypothetical protein